MRNYVVSRNGSVTPNSMESCKPVVIYFESANCFKARAISEQFDEFEAMIKGMRSRGVNVKVLEDQGLTKRFCIN